MRASGTERTKSKEMKRAIIYLETFKTAVVRVLVLMLAVAGVGLLAPAAHADVIYQFAYDGCSGGCGMQSSFGTLELQQVDPTTVKISVSLLNNNEFVTTGSHAGIAFNFVGGDVIVSDLPDGWSNAGANVTEPGFGNFAHGI